MDKEKETDNLSSCSPTTRETGNPSSCSPTTREVVSNYPVGGEQLHIKTPYNKTPNNKTHIYSSKMLLQVFDTWNEQKIVTHRSNYQGLKRIPTQIKIILSNDYSVQDIEQAIRNFRDVLKSEDTFWTHRWTLEKFLEWDRLFEFFPDQFEIETWLKFSTKKKQEKNAKRHSKINPKEDLNWYEKTMIYRGEKDEVRSNKNEASKDIYVAKERISVLEKPGGL